MKLSRFAEAALRLIYPAECSACSHLLELDEKHLCAACSAALKSKKQFPAAPLDLSLSPLRETWAFYSYEFPVREILTGIKFQRKTWLAGVFGGDFAGLTGAFKGKADLIVPVPLDRMKFIQREFNQSSLLAREASKALGIPVSEILEKKYATPAQNRLDRGDRAVNLNGAFRVKHPEKIQNKKVLLIDDVLTTGATAREAARTLKKNGAACVFLMAAAHTKDRKEAVS